ncbi:hypothetical protein EA796_01785 [Pseudomonas sp. AOB-7]|uniref:hypothetical protein n=1 Tax=Pseudomonas sp. NPDC077649 TaxID=3364423 RepID=UPI000EFC00D1|nr:hypothetical protein EA796_01785 [Pseudomonas sp. AOB-7]
MKSTKRIAIVIVLLSLAISGLESENRSWSTQGNDVDGLHSTCTDQSGHDVKLSIYGGDQCLAFMLI